MGLTPTAGDGQLDGGVTGTQSQGREAIGVQRPVGVLLLQRSELIRRGAATTTVELRNGSRLLVQVLREDLKVLVELR